MRRSNVVLTIQRLHLLGYSKAACNSASISNHMLKAGGVSVSVAAPFAPLVRCARLQWWTSSARLQLVALCPATRAVWACTHKMQPGFSATTMCWAPGMLHCAVLFAPLQLAMLVADHKFQQVGWRDRAPGPPLSGKVGAISARQHNFAWSRQPPLWRSRVQQVLLPGLPEAEMEGAGGQPGRWRAHRDGSGGWQEGPDRGARVGAGRGEWKRGWG
jgi:hypothetical protein